MKPITGLEKQLDQHLNNLSPKKQIETRLEHIFMHLPAIYKAYASLKSDSDIADSLTQIKRLGINILNVTQSFDKITSTSDLLDLFSKQLHIDLIASLGRVKQEVHEERIGPKLKETIDLSQKSLNRAISVESNHE